MSVKRFSLALVLCAAMAFTACDKEGGNQSGPDTDPVTPTENTVDVAYAIGGGADFLLIFDAEVKYTDAAGKTATEKSAPCHGRRNSPASHFPTPLKWK